MSDLLDFSPPGQTTFTLSGAKARFYDAGTTTLRTVYTDQSETVPHPSPLIADASGRWPQAFVSGGPVKVVVTQADESTGYTLDPCEKVAASGAGASTISFAPTVDLPFTNVQAAIEGAAASAASGFTPFGLGVTGSVALLADINATNIASGQYRFDGTTAGTYPTGVAAADTGAVRIERETSGSAWMVLYHDTTDRVFYRRMNASTWGAWRENIIADIGATQGDILYRSATNWTRLAAGAANSLLKSGGSGANPSWGSSVTLGTAVASTSGTSIDFTGIPSTARRVTVMLAGVSTNGTSGKIIQIGDNGGIETTGYLGSETNATGAGTGSANLTSGFGIRSVSAADVIHGKMEICLVDPATNTWVATGIFGLSNQAFTAFGGGGKSLSATLDRIRLTTQGSTDTFDAGTVNISYE